MAQERVSIRKIKEILRLKYENKLSSRQTAKSAGVSRDAVAKYLERAKTAGVDWPKDKDLTADNLFFYFIILPLLIAKNSMILFNKPPSGV